MQTADQLAAADALILKYRRLLGDYSQFVSGINAEASCEHDTSELDAEDVRLDKEYHALFG